MHRISSKITDVVTFPARTAVGVASTGVRATARVLGWAAERAVGQSPTRSAPDVAETGTAAATDAPATTAPPKKEPATTAPPKNEPATTAPPKKVPAKGVPAKKVPASQVPLKSAPTPSMPAGVEAIDAALESSEPAPSAKSGARKTTTKKTTAKKTTTKAAARKTARKKAPSKQAAVLAPALGLSEDEVAERVETDADET